MLAELILATVIVTMEPSEAMLQPGKPVAPIGVTGAHRAPLQPKPAKRRNCVVPAELPQDPSITYVDDKSAVPADLPGPQYEIVDKIEIPLSLYLPPPAPFGTEIALGKAEIDTSTGALSINGETYSPHRQGCR